jgi:alcohol dehydrogenase, propanol-preferring
MKAWTLETPAPIDERPLHLSEIAMPSPADNELLLRVNACGICRTDLHIVEGELPVLRSPVVPGHQIVGRVAALGARAEGFDI